MGERVAKILTAPFARFTPTLLTTPLDILAKSMIANTINKQSEENSSVDIVDNNRIFKLAELYDQSK
jgi:hypothetical protein